MWSNGPMAGAKIDQQASASFCSTVFAGPAMVNAKLSSELGPSGCRQAEGMHSQFINFPPVPLTGLP